MELKSKLLELGKGTFEYNEELDILVLHTNGRKVYAYSDEEDGIIKDFDINMKLTGYEILDFKDRKEDKQ